MNAFIFILIGSAVSFLVLMIAIFCYENKNSEITEEEKENWQMTLADKLAKLEEDKPINETNYVKAKNKK